MRRTGPSPAIGPLPVRHRALCWTAGILSGCLILIALSTSSRAAPSGPAAEAIASICDQSGTRAAKATGVPLAVLRAISLTETGRKLGGRHRPWPWTVNMEGKGIWFDTRAEALAYVRKHFARGARSFDVGCFQINYRWHGKAFRSIEDMFEPDLNALYAGRFLRTLFSEKGDWPRAAGAYHSRTPKYATRYAARFTRILARLTGKSQAPIPELAQPGVIPDVVGHPVNGRGVAAVGQTGYGTQPLAAQTPAARTPAVEPPKGPAHWVPPAPSATGSIAAIDLAPKTGSLLVRAPGSLF